MDPASKVNKTVNSLMAKFPDQPLHLFWVAVTSAGDPDVTLEIARRLADQPQSPSSKSRYRNEKGVEVGEGTTFLILATVAGRPPIVKGLLVAGASTDTADLTFGRTALHMVATSKTENSKEILDILLSYGAKTDVKDKEGLTPLHYAAEHDHVAAIHTLIDKGKANIFATDHKSDTSLHRSITYRAQQATLALLGHGAHPNEALHIAAYCGFDDMITLLADKGADLNLVNEKGETPLHRAVLGYAPRWVVEVLIAEGADPTITVTVPSNGRSLTPCELFTMANYEELGDDEEEGEEDADRKRIIHLLSGQSSA